MYVKRPEILLLSIEVLIFTLQFYRCIYEALIYYHEHLIHNFSISIKLQTHKHTFHL